MGTRNLIMVVSDGETKLAQYNQFDGHIDSAGVSVLRFLHGANLKTFKEKVKNVEHISSDEANAIYEEFKNDKLFGHEADKWFERQYPSLCRNMGEDLLYHVLKTNGNFPVINRVWFGYDSLFCEYGYVIDLDQNTFEIYFGFNEEPIEEGRWTSADLERLMAEYPEAEDFKYINKDYHPIKLVKTYSLDDLPTEEDFINELSPEDEDEEYDNSQEV